MLAANADPSLECQWVLRVTLTENEKTIEYAMRFGGMNVRGGRYFFPKKLAEKAERRRRELALASTVVATPASIASGGLPASNLSSSR
jgi:hypothetical protein